MVISIDSMRILYCSRPIQDELRAKLQKGGALEIVREASKKFQDSAEEMQVFDNCINNLMVEDLTGTLCYTMYLLPQFFTKWRQKWNMYEIVRLLNRILFGIMGK